jgi:hypothetical protein
MFEPRDRPARLIDGGCDLRSPLTVREAFEEFDRPGF